jgi:hypothetical protein
MHHKGFSFVDLVGILVITAMIAGLMFPTLQASREAARRTACAKNLQRLGVAIKQYHDTHNVLPTNKFGPRAGNRISGFTALLPHLGYESLYNDIDTAKWQVGWRREKVDENGKPVLDAEGKQMPGPYCTMIPEFLCPTDTAGFDRVPLMLGYNNYVFSHGDWITGQDEKFSRGAFTPDVRISLDAVVDGISNTLAMSERCAAPVRDRQLYPAENSGVQNQGLEEVSERISIKGGVRLDMKEAVSEDLTKQDVDVCWKTAKGDYFVGNENVTRVNRSWAGSRWADGMHFFTATNTIMPPNGPSCAARTNDQTPLLAPPTSYHITGVNGLMLDGQVRFISNSIDYGGDYAGKKCVKDGRSPFGVWGAMGSVAGTAPVEVK